MSISERLKQVIESKNLNIKEFSELSGIPYRSVQNYLRNEREPNVEALTKLQERMGIDINWLLTGKGAMLVIEIDSNSLSEQEMRLLKNYRQSSERLQKAIQDVTKILSET